MTVPKLLQEFLSTTEDISINYSELNFYSPADIEAAQVGYSVGSHGQSLTGDKDGLWKNEWVVIATDDLGDPVIIDISSPDLTVMSAAHGMGSWEPFIIARSLDNFKAIIAGLRDLSTDRADPAEFEENPLEEDEKQKFREMVRQIDPEIDAFYWEIFLATDEELDSEVGD